MQLLECQITQKCIELASSLLPSNASFDFHLPEHAHWRVEIKSSRGLSVIKTIMIDELENSSKPSDLILRCSYNIFYSILLGKINPIRAFWEDEIELFGDVGLALTLYSVLPKFQDLGILHPEM